MRFDREPYILSSAAVFDHALSTEEIAAFAWPTSGDEPVVWNDEEIDEEKIDREWIVQNESVSVDIDVRSEDPTNILSTAMVPKGALVQVAPGGLGQTALPATVEGFYYILESAATPVGPFTGETSQQAAECPGLRLESNENDAAARFFRIGIKAK